MTRIQRSVVAATFAVLAFSPAARGQLGNSLCDDIAELRSDHHEYLPLKSRWQDEDKTPLDQRVLRLGAKAIPRLISCLADDRRTGVRGELWSQPTVAMVAFSMLWDLFTDWQGGVTGYRYTIHGPIAWDDLCAEGPEHMLYPCPVGWADYLRSYGRHGIQQTWQKIWTQDKDLIYWDEASKCFRVKAAP